MKTIMDYVGYVMKNRSRAIVVKHLGKHLMMPSDLAKVTGIHKNHVSRALKELRHANLAVCVSPNIRAGRFYQLSRKGQEVEENMKKVNGEWKYSEECYECGSTDHWIELAGTGCSVCNSRYMNNIGSDYSELDNMTEANKKIIFDNEWKWRN